MVTVDGRQTFSVGMSLPEFADLLLKLGACQAINLDGGGSTTMVLEGQIVNYPSDQTGERSVGNCLLLVARR
jgi:exopolysaccharide biosynthesis protein